MKFLSLSIIFIFAVITANGEMDSVATTLKPTVATTLKPTVAPETPKYKYIETAGTQFASSKGPDATGSWMPVQLPPCEKICFRTLNCGEWNYCSLHHPDQCTGLQRVCTDFEGIMKTAEDLIQMATDANAEDSPSVYPSERIDTSDSSNCFFSTANLFCMVELSLFLLIILIVVHALFKYLADDKEAPEKLKLSNSASDATNSLKPIIEQTKNKNSLLCPMDMIV